MITSITLKLICGVLIPESKMLYSRVALIILCVAYNAFVAVGSAEITKQELAITNESGMAYRDLLIVSTIDGKISVLKSSDGELIWSHDTEPTGLLSSSFNQLQVISQGKKVRLIPALDGELYKFDGKILEPLPFSAEMMLSTSYKVGDNLNIVGAKDIKSYGISLLTGKLRYMCSSKGCEQYSAVSETEDILVVKKHLQTVRAVSSRTGDDQWSYRTGKHHVVLSKGLKLDASSTEELERVTNAENLLSSEKLHFKIQKGISVSMVDGLITYLDPTTNQYRWSQKFSSPIVDMWQLHGDNMVYIDLFKKTEFFKENELPSPLLLGIYEDKLYIKQTNEKVQDSALNQQISFQLEQRYMSVWIPVFSEKSSEPLPATTQGLTLVHSTTSSDKGIFFYENNSSSATSSQCYAKNASKFTFMDGSLLFHIYAWRETALLCMGTVLFSMACWLILRHVLKATEMQCGSDMASENEEESVPQDEVEISVVSESAVSSKSQIASKYSDVFMYSSYQSRFLSDFELIECLGKGGYGVVFEARNKIDCCRYAVKRIQFSRNHIFDRVLREVKVLAKLDHKGIVRYYNAWVETAPAGYMDACITDFIDISFSSVSGVSVTSEKLRTNNQNPLKPFHDMVLSQNTTNEAFSNSGNYRLHSSSYDNIIKPQHIENSVEDEIVTLKGKKKIGPNMIDDKYAETVKYLFIQMQLCQKESLREWLSTNRSGRNHTEVLDIFYQIVVAVEYVHSQGLMHRDLKPSNIFFSLDGMVKIGDFGLVSSENENKLRSLENTKNKSILKHTDDVGTELYKSPEVACGLCYNHKIDIFALGLIFYELMVPFFTEFERIKVLTKIKSGDFPEDFKNNFKVEHQLATMLLKNNPDKRPSAAEIKVHPIFDSIHKYSRQRNNMY